MSKKYDLLDKGDMKELREAAAKIDNVIQFERLCKTCGCTLQKGHEEYCSNRCTLLETDDAHDQK